MTEQNKRHSKFPKWMQSNAFLGLLTLILWVISAVFSFYVVLEFQQMILRWFVTCCPDERWNFQVLRQWSTIFLIAVWLGFTTITGEYHYQHLRQKVSWKVFKWSYLILLVILLVAWIF